MYTHDIDNPHGNMVVTQEDLPDGSVLTHEYDCEVDVGLPAVPRRFGFRTKTTRTKGGNSLVTFDADYKFFTGGSPNQLLKWPQLVRQRDGRGASSLVTYTYDGTSNRIASRTGPTITLGTSGPRTPKVEYGYSSGLLSSVKTYDTATTYRQITYGYDSLGRMISQTVDPGGKNLVTSYFYCDTAATQDRVTRDPDGYVTWTRYDAGGRPQYIYRFLGTPVDIPAPPCTPPTGAPHCLTTYAYDTYGHLDYTTVENKDHDGNPLTPASITTDFTYDPIGRLTLKVVDPGGTGHANAQTHFTYNWQDQLKRESDNSGRGSERDYDGRGLLASETPLESGPAPHTALKRCFEYDAMGGLRISRFETQASREWFENVYDDFGRLSQKKRKAGTGGGNDIITTYEYDAANHITRTYVDEAGVRLADSTALYDQGGFNYESRQRLSADGTDGNEDPVTRRKFDAAGNVIEEASLGDSTVGDRTVTTHYDRANRVDYVADSLGGRTDYVRDGRGNVTDQTVKLDATRTAVTEMEYNALGLAWKITDPAGHWRERLYDCRGNLLRETAKDSSGTARMLTRYACDGAGRRTQQAIMRNATNAGGTPSTAQDHVVDLEYYPDGRLHYHKTYNNNNATPLTTETTYDTLGRVYALTDPSGASTIDNYAADGRLDNRVVNDGVGTRTLTFAYDGHDRATSQTALGVAPDPSLVTQFQYDGLDRQIRVINPRNVVTRTDFDRAGRRIAVTENEGGPLERVTAFAYNRLSQFITQTAQNINNGQPQSQVTTYRHDPLGRTLRAVYPDAPGAQHNDPMNCTDCLRADYDLAGRLLHHTDQRGRLMEFEYDGRGLLLLRGADMGAGLVFDSFGYDALGRMTLADRGTDLDPTAISHTAMVYNADPAGTNDLGDLLSETQTMAGGVPRTLAYAYDQAGNRTGMAYPGGATLTYTPTVLNQVDTVTLDSAPLIDYDYYGGPAGNGPLLQKRRVTTNNASPTVVYETGWGYDGHRRVNAVNNVLEKDGIRENVALFGYSHDNNGNPLSETPAGRADFARDARVLVVDPLDRLLSAAFPTFGQVDSSVLDLAGNRESHTSRTGQMPVYALANPANEYAAIDPDGSGPQAPLPLSYDPAGNLSRDEAGRYYDYDEQNRLTEVRASDNATVLAAYAYDALGRRIASDAGGVFTQYVYDGRSAIEEYDAAGIRLRYHVNGGQYIDERVCTYTDVPGGGGEMAMAVGDPAGAVSDADVSATDDPQITQTTGTVSAADALATTGDDWDDARASMYNALLEILASLGITDPAATPPLDKGGAGESSPSLTEDAEASSAVAVDGLSDPETLTLTGSAGGFTYYLLKDSFSVVGLGNAAGTIIRRLDYTPGGDFVGGSVVRTDFDFDTDVDLMDYTAFSGCFNGPNNPPKANCAADADLDEDGDVDQADFLRFQACFNGPNRPPKAASCYESTPPASGSWALHGRPAEKLHDPTTGTDVVLQDFRARTYDPQNARWLQRDPKGYADGANLYEAFRGNPTRFADPDGRDSIEGEGDFLVYHADGFHWPFGRILPNGQVLIDHPDWPYAFIVDRAFAESEFRYSWPRAWFADRFRSPFEIMQHATAMASPSGLPSKCSYIYDKHSRTQGWAKPQDVAFGERGETFYAAGQAGRLRQVSEAADYTRVAFSVTTGAVAGPAGVGGMAADIVATGADIIGGRVDLGSGAAVIAVTTAAMLLHTRAGMVDDVVGGAGGLEPRMRVGKHGDMPTPRGGQQSHHGAMSAWTKSRFLSYDPDRAPAILMPEASHEATFGVYNTWRADMRQAMGGTFDWTKVSEQQMRTLSEKMFDAAGVPTQVRQQYWAEFERMKAALRRDRADESRGG